MVVSVTTMQRLALIKFLSGVAIEQSQRPEPLCSIAILTFHDAIELFLQLSCEHLDISMSKSKIGFLEYWELIAPKVSTGELTQKESMKRLNSARVEFKHNGTLPSKLAIEGFRVNATTFIEENTLAVFGIELSSVSLLDLVQCDEARTSLRESEELIKQNKIEDALDKAALAFQQLISDYEKRKTSKFGRSPFFFGRDMTFLSSFAMDFGQLGAGARFKQKMIEFVDKVNESLESLQQAIKILSLGIDYRRYTRFKLLTPQIDYFINGSHRAYRFSKEKPTGKEDAQFCIDFVVESAIKLQEFDYSLEEQ